MPCHRNAGTMEKMYGITRTWIREKLLLFVLFWLQLKFCMFNEIKFPCEKSAHWNETKRNKLLELGNSNKPKLKLVAKWFLSFSCAFSRNVRVDQPNICFVRLFIRCIWYIYPFMKCRPHAFCRNVYFWEKSTNYGGLGPRSPNEYLNSIHSLGAWRCSTREKYSS